MRVQLKRNKKRDSCTQGHELKKQHIFPELSPIWCRGQNFPWNYFHLPKIKYHTSRMIAGRSISQKKVDTLYMRDPYVFI